MQGGICILLLAGSAVLSSCAPKLPRMVAVSGVELERVQERLNSFLEQSCVQAVDADVRVQWQVYGQQETWPAVLQAMTGGFMRLSVLDPLGRPLLLLAVNGTDKNFVLADNSKAVGYKGELNSPSVQDYLPESIAGSDLFFWLSGQVSRDGMRVVSMRRDAVEPVFWYELGYPGNGQHHLIGLNERRQLSKHLIVDENDTIVIAAGYSGYTATTMDCDWPGKVEMSGKSLPADLTLEFSRVYSFQPLEKKRFQLELPAHFTVQTLQ